MIAPKLDGEPPQRLSILWERQILCQTRGATPERLLSTRICGASPGLARHARRPIFQKKLLFLAEITIFKVVVPNRRESGLSFGAAPFGRLVPQNILEVTLMKEFSTCWHFVGGCLFALGLLAESSRAYVSSDNRLPSPVYQSTNGVSFSTPAGQYYIDSFFDIFVDFQRIPPPLTGSAVNSFFDVFVEIDLGIAGGPPVTVQPVPQLALRLNGLPPGTPYPYFFDTEMLQLELTGGGLPAGVRIRESPTISSTGQTNIADLGGGLYQIDSFFDVFTELSIDGGQTWVPSSGPLHLVGGLPEPSSAVLAAMGLAAFGWLRGRRDNR
jgi:hypothetical protein